MKKIIIASLLLIFCLPVFASQWIEIFGKKYIDFESIELYPKDKIIKFWTKNLRVNPKEKYDNEDYWYTVSKWALSCNTKEHRIEAISIYNLKDELIDADSTIPNWNAIAPDTYAEGYYKMFCLLPFNKNPLLNGGK